MILTGNQPLQIKYREIAGNLETSREAVSRGVKKIEDEEGKI